MVARVLLLLALVACAAAACPKGTQAGTSKQRRQAEALGYEAFQYRAKDVCKKYPELLESGGLKTLGVVITPVCTDGKGAWTYTVKARNPCNGNKMSTGSLSITPTNKMNWVDIVNVWAGATATKDWSQASMLPIPCPKGFRTASYKDKGAILEPFLYDYLTTEQMMKPVLRKAGLGGWWCEIGFENIAISRVTGCIETAPRDEPDIMANAKVSYNCYASNKKYTLGLEVSGEYNMEAIWKVDLHL